MEKGLRMLEMKIFILYVIEQMYSTKKNIRHRTSKRLSWISFQQHEKLYETCDTTKKVCLNAYT